MHYMTSAYTDVGIKKKINQDAMTLLSVNTSLGEIVFAVLCDGMGGHSRGEFASGHMIRSLSEWFQRELPMLLNQRCSLGDIQRSMKNCVCRNSERIFAFAKSQNLVIGTTLTAVLIIRDRYLGVHVGDSRLYLLDDTIRQLTTDHSYVARLVAQGVITKDQARRDARRNLLLQSVGGSEKLNPQCFGGVVKESDVFLICCDGFYHEISEEEMYQCFSAKVLPSEDKMKYRSRLMVDLAKERNETDNISILLVKAGE